MKKVIAIILTLAISLFSTPIYASNATTYEDYADSLSTLGVFLGTGGGYELDRSPTRVEGLVMLIRLLGAEDDANKMKGSETPFTDVPKWATGYVAYAYENGLARGVSDTKFGSSNTMESKAFLTFLLRSLGYNDAAGDFSYNNALTFSKGIGLINNSMYSTLSDSIFLRAHIAKTSYDTLKFPVQGTDTLLIDKLIAEGKVNFKIGNEFKATVLSEPETSTNLNTKSTTEIAKNADSIVMLNCSNAEGGAIGSGVIISSGGDIVTNYHVIAGATSIKINFNDGSQYTGQVYVQDYDEDLDLAVIKINKTGLKAVKIGASNTLKQGEAIVAIGSPYGYFNTVTEGIVSAIRDSGIQISAAINPGSSGGGLFNKNGELVGITYSGVLEADNIGFAIPTDKLTRVSKKNMLSLLDFSHGSSLVIGTIKPPDNIYMVLEDYDTVLLNWNSVKGADYYYFYYQEDGENTFWYDEEAGSQLRFYYDNNYSCTFSNLIPGTRYNIKITSVSNGVESADSKIFSFIKGNINSNNYYSIYYEDNYGVPDFGKIAGCSPYSAYSDSYFYHINDFKASDIRLYGDTLKKCGFNFVRSFIDANGYTVMVYENYDLNKTVMAGVALIYDIYGYFIFIT